MNEFQGLEPAVNEKASSLLDFFVATGLTDPTVKAAKDKYFAAKGIDETKLVPADKDLWRQAFKAAMDFYSREYLTRYEKYLQSLTSKAVTEPAEVQALVEKAKQNIAKEPDPKKKKYKTAAMRMAADTYYAEVVQKKQEEKAATGLGIAKDYAEYRSKKAGGASALDLAAFITSKEQECVAKGWTSAPGQLEAIFESAFNIEQALTTPAFDVDRVDADLAELEKLTNTSGSGHSETQIIYSRLMDLRKAKVRDIIQDNALIVNVAAEILDDDDRKLFNTVFSKAQKLRQTLITTNARGSYSFASLPPELGQQLELQLEPIQSNKHTIDLLKADWDPGSAHFTEMELLVSSLEVVIRDAQILLGTYTGDVRTEYGDDIEFWLSIVQPEIGILVENVEGLWQAYDNKNRTFEPADKPHLTKLRDTLIAKLGTLDKGDKSYIKRLNTVDVQINRVNEMLDSIDRARTQEKLGNSKWTEFQREYLVDEGLPIELVGVISPEADAEQCKAFMKWTMSQWYAHKNAANPFVGLDILEETIPNVGEDLKVADLLKDIGKTSLQTISWIFGPCKMLTNAKKMYDAQKTPADQYDLYKNFEINTLGHLTKVKESLSGNLSTAEYIQYGVIFVMLHDVVERVPQYDDALTYDEKSKVPTGKILPDWMDKFKKHVRDKTEPKYGTGLPLRDILYSEQASVSPDDHKALTTQMAKFILDHDKVHGGGELLLEHAEFYAEMALNSAEFFGIVETTDKTYTSQRIKARFSFLEQYRKLKIANKELGSARTIKFFRIFLQPILKQNLVEGTSLEEVYFLSGMTNPDRRKKYGIKVAKKGPDGKAIKKANGEFEYVDAALPDSIVDLTQTGILDRFDQTFGQNYHRLSEFVEKMYEMLTGKEATGVLDGDGTKVRKLYNDIVTYYEGDITKKITGEYAFRSDNHKTENEKDYFERIKELRLKYANNGYMLVKSVMPVKGDADGTYIRTEKDVKTQKDVKLVVTDIERADTKEEYVFTPMVDWFDLLMGAEGVNAKNQDLLDEIGDIVAYSNEDYKSWQAAQQMLAEKLGGENLREQMRLELVKWLCINEMGLKRDEFLKKENKDKLPDIKRLFGVLNQGVHNIQFMGMKNRSNPATYAAFGKFSFPTVEGMLYTAQWLRKGFESDQFLKAEIKLLARKAKGTKKAGIKPKLG